MGGYWPCCCCFFFAFLWTEIKSKSIKTQKIRGQYPAVLAKQAWSVKDYMAENRTFSCGITSGNPEIALSGSQSGRRILSIFRLVDLAI